jgi:hypothetical protein
VRVVPLVRYPFKIFYMFNDETITILIFDTLHAVVARRMITKPQAESGAQLRDSFQNGFSLLSTWPRLGAIWAAREAVVPIGFVTPWMRPAFFVTLSHAWSPAASCEIHFSSIRCSTRYETSGYRDATSATAFSRPKIANVIASRPPLLS